MRTNDDGRGRPKPERPEYADYLILSIRGRPVRRDRLWSQVKRIAFWAGIEKNVSPHIFRHSMITHMAEKGLPATFIQAQSRHKSLDMVARYTHLSEKSVRDAYDQAFEKRPHAQQPSHSAALESVQEPSMPARKAKSEGSIKERLLELYLDGKISDDKIGRLEKLLSMLDGQQVRESAVEMKGYA